MKLSHVKSCVLVAGVLGALVLAGCGAGRDAATSLTRPSIPGVDADAGGIQVRNAAVAFSPDGYAPGDGASAMLFISNTGQEPVRLTRLASEGAGSVTVAGATRVGAASPSPGASPTPAGGAGAQVQVAPGQLFAVTLEVTGLRQQLNGTTALPLVLTFDNGVELQLAVPMDTPLESQPRESPVVEQPEH